MEKDLELRVSELEKMLFLSKNVLSFDEASKFLVLWFMIWQQVSVLLYSSGMKSGLCGMNRKHVSVWHCWNITGWH